jgi:hypothetical protein
VRLRVSVRPEEKRRETDLYVVDSRIYAVIACDRQACSRGCKSLFYACSPLDQETESVPFPIAGAPDRVAEEITVLTGMELGSDDVVRVLDFRDWK